MENIFWSKTLSIKNKPCIENNNILDDNDLDKIYSDEQTKLQKNLSWFYIDLNNKQDIKIIIDFLNNNYHNKNSSSYFNFNEDFLRWLILIPNSPKELHLGIKYKNKIVGTIFGSIFDLNLNGKKTKASEINLLCVNKKLRNLNLSLTLINEVARISYKKFNLKLGLYISKLSLPNKLSNFNYYYRMINFERLIKYDEIEDPNVDMKLLEKIFKPKKINIKGKYRLLQLKDCEYCCKKLNEKLTKLNLSYHFSLEKFIHFFLPQENIVKTFVVENKNKITDMISFYYQDILVEKHNVKIKNANLFYYFNNKNSLSNLVNIVLNIANNDSIDRIKVLGQMGYDQLEDKLDFCKGSTKMNLYLFNWKCQKIKSKDVAYFVI